MESIEEMVWRKKQVYKEQHISFLNSKTNFKIDETH